MTEKKNTIIILDKTNRNLDEKKFNATLNFVSFQ